MSHVRENFRVVVEIDDSYTMVKDLRMKERILERRADEVLANIKRHVDGIKSTHIISDRVCEHCGYGWEEPPNCCNESCNEWDSAHPQTQDSPA